MEIAEVQGEHEQSLSVALTNMRTALEIIDAAAAPGQIAAHLDMAIETLKEHLAQQPQLDVAGDRIPFEQLEITSKPNLNS